MSLCQRKKLDVYVKWQIDGRLYMMYKKLSWIVALVAVG